MRKLILFAVGFTAACAAGVYLQMNILCLVLGLLCLLGFIGSFFFASKPAKIVAAILLGVVIGFVWVCGFRGLYLNTAKNHDGETMPVTIIVSDYSYTPNYGQAFDGYLELDGKHYQVRCYLNEDRKITPGQTVTGEFRLRFTGAGGEREATHHQGKGIFLLVTQKSDVQIAEGQIRIMDYPALWRQKITQRITEIFPADGAGFARALLLGDTAGLTYPQNRAFQVSGLRHVVAVSGLHVSILFALIYMAFGHRRVLNALFGIPLLLIFAAIAGFTPSIVRACLMQFLMLLSMLTDKEYDPPTALAFAVLVILGINPMTITSVSFQLSVGCMIGIFAFSESLRQYFLSFGNLKEKSKGKSGKAKCIRWFTGSVAVTLSAMVVTTPLCALYFGMISLVGILTANVESIGNATFGQTQIAAFTVAEGNANYKAVDGVVYTKDDAILVAYPPMGATEYTVLDGCRGIGGGAFYGAQVQKVTLPETMRAFDNYAFTSSQLSEMNTPASLQYMGENALYNTQFTTFTFPEGMTTLYEGVMAYCEKLQSVTLPTTLKYIGFHAFFVDKALTEVHCLGAEPAYLDFYEEGDHPFGYIDRANVTVSVPKGRLDAYKSSYWGSEFSNLVDTEAPIFFPDSFTPATESELTELGTIEITFPTEATVENSLPKISVSKNSEIYGEPVEDFGWMAVNNSADKKTVSVFPQDEYGEGFVQPIKLEAGVNYFVKLPAGFIKDSEGVMNQAMTLQFVGKEESSVSVVESSNCFVLNTANGFDVVLGGLQNATVEMFSTTGALVNKVNNANGTVSLNAEANGMYIIRVIDGNKAYTFKVVK